MTREEVIRLAKEAGICFRTQPPGTREVFCWQSDIERFYAIAFEAGRQAEREEIMKDLLPPITAPQTKAHYIANEIAYALCNLILARGDSK